MRNKAVLFGAAFLLSAALSAQDFDENKPRVIGGEMAPKEEAERKPSCKDFTFGAGCMAFSVGPAFGSVNDTLTYGVIGGFSYFVLDRLALEANAGALFSSYANNYYIGPGASYYIGPFSGYLFNVSVVANRQFFRGAVQAEGWSYGPSVGVMTNLFGRIFWGISIKYRIFETDGYKTSDWQWSPVVFIPF